MSQLRKPRFHDEECFGPPGPNAILETTIDNAPSDGIECLSSADLMRSARQHFANEDVKAAVDDIVSAYESLAVEKAKLTALRNQAFRDLSTLQGWQGSPHPEALRLRRLTPSIPLRST